MKDLFVLLLIAGIVLTIFLKEEIISYSKLLLDKIKARF